MKSRQLFRYTHQTYEYIAEIVPVQDFVPPREYPDSVSYWINLHITRTSAKRNGRKISRDYNCHDGRYEMGLESGDGLKVAFALRDLFSKWLEEDKPEFLTIAAYRDDRDKRLRIYKRFFKSRGYDLYYIDRSDRFDPVYQFCRSDLRFKHKTL